MIGEFEKIVEEKGVWIEPCQKRFTAFHLDMSFPFVIMTLCLSGTARALYDQREMTHRKNDLALLLPGHVMRPLECSEDYTYARIAISKGMIERLRSQLFLSLFQARYRAYSERISTQIMPKMARKAYKMHFF